MHRVGEIKWVKLSVNMFDDEKIKLIRTMPEGESIVIVWIHFLCMAGKTNDGGAIYMGQNLYYTEEMLATICGISINTMRIALNTLSQFNMIDILENGEIEIVNWDKHQNVEGMERVKDGNAERQRIWYYRNKIKELGYDSSSEEFPDDSEQLKEIYRTLKKKPNVSLTLGSRQPNGPEEELEEELEEDNSSSSNGQKIINFYQENIGMTTPYIMEGLSKWVQEASEDLVMEACKIAVENGKTKYSYINGILNNWSKKNIKTLEDVRAMQVAHDNEQNQKVPYSRRRSGHQEVIPEWAKNRDKPKEPVKPQTEEEKTMTAEDIKKRLDRIMGKSE